jgi:glycolate oxidase subunit GlcD
MDQLVNSLRAAVGPGRVIDDPEELLVYECDGVPHYKARPRAVVFPGSTEEVAEVVGVLARAGVAFAPRGAGTGLSGGALALGGGVQLSLSRMRRVLKVDAENRLAVVETGVVNAQVSRAAAPAGLHYAPDPSSQASCTIGGNVAENAGGIHCLKYGTTVDHVLALRVVLSDGRVVELGGGGAEAPGFDLVGLFVGSEGTFGVATEATVRLTPSAPSVRTLLADFVDVDDASRAVSAVIAEGIVPAALEMVDGETIRAVEQSVFAAGLPEDAEAALLVELDGFEAGLDEEVERVRALCVGHGARGVRLAADEAERKRLWAARKGAFGAMGRVSPDLMLQDAVVPRSRLPEVLREVGRTAARHRLRVANLFHAGDGNLHPVICYDARDPEEVRRVKEAGREIVETCVRAGGTITGEHGVGLDKKEYLPLVYDEDALRAMLEVRAAFDPAGLCNPGKIIPELKGCGEGRAVVEAKRQAVEVAVVTTQPTAVSWSRASSSSTTAGADEARRTLAGASHVEDGVGGALVVSPSSVEEAREVLLAARALKLGVVPVGAGSWPDAGRMSSPPRVLLKTTRMARVVEHEPADLVATVEAGARLAEFNRAVGGGGQWLALDPPGAGVATVGGVAATGLAGPLGLAYGAPRAHVLGMKVLLADGRVVRAGGRVVKNVAGYDLCKLFTGSYGTLGVILELTFKLRPRPPRDATLVVNSRDWRGLHAAARAVTSAHLRPAAAELLSPALARDLGAHEEDAALLLRFNGARAAVGYQLGEARELVSRHGLTSELLSDDANVWSRLSDYAGGAGDRLVWRASVLPTRLGELLAEVGGRAWHAGVGDGRVRVFEDEGESVGSLRRRAHDLGGSLVVERAPDEVKTRLDVWGLSESAAFLMRRLKGQLDPADVFSPGRFF